VLAVHSSSVSRLLAHKLLCLDVLDTRRIGFNQPLAHLGHLCVDISTTDLVSAYVSGLCQDLATSEGFRSSSSLLLHRQRQLQWLLLAALHNFLPQLSLVLNTFELGFDMLLRDLQEPENTVVSFLRNHVQNVPEALRAPLAPCLVDTE